MADIGANHQHLSLTQIAEKAHNQLGFGQTSLYSRQWLMYHFKRAQDFPFFYTGKARVFPIHCGRTLQLTAAQEKELFDRIEQRLRRKDLK